MSKLHLVAGTLLALILATAVAYGLTWRAEIDPIETPDPDSLDPALVDQGARLAAVGNCIACHTVPGNDAFAGGLAIPTPFGTIHSTNITPDAETGIGRWSLKAFKRALHRGIDREGHHLYPAFPYDHYTLVSDNDAEAIYTYLMSREPVEATAPDNELTFPLNFRPLVAGWKLLFLEDGRYVRNEGQSDIWNRGAYLAEGLGHCGACHTPRNILGARDMSRKWSGGQSEGWTAYPIDANSPAPIPWDREGLTFYLRNGWHPEHGVSRGPMADVTGNLGRLPDEDVTAIATYTAHMLGTPSEERLQAAAALRETVATGRGLGQQADTQGASSPISAETRGARIYESACATCHESGRPQPYGGLDFRLSTAVNADSPQNIINVTLYGLPPADGEASAVMPAYKGVLSDADMVALLEHLRSTFTDKPQWDGLEELVAETRSGEHHVSIRPTDGIERAPGNLGAEEQPWRQD